MIKEMRADDAINLYSELQKLEIDSWIDGGWGADALIGKQTREHEDLDIIIQEKDVPKTKEFLGSQGYKIIERNDLAENNFHMIDDEGHEVDVTAIHFNEKGDGIFGQEKNNEFNPADSFKGVGKIDDREVKCVSLEYAIKFRLDHEIWKHDAEDVKALCEKFGIEVPSVYNK